MEPAVRKAGHGDQTRGWALPAASHAPLWTELSTGTQLHAMLPTHHPPYLPASTKLQSSEDNPFKVKHKLMEREKREEPHCLSYCYLKLKTPRCAPPHPQDGYLEQLDSDGDLCCPSYCCTRARTLQYGFSISSSMLLFLKSEGTSKEECVSPSGQLPRTKRWPLSER